MKARTKKSVAPSAYGADLLQSFSANLKAFRTRLDLTQQEVAEATGVTTTYISRLEKGKRVPSLEVAIRLCDILKVSFPQLFGYEEAIRIDELLNDKEAKERLFNEAIREGFENAVHKLFGQSTGKNLKARSA